MMENQEVRWLSPFDGNIMGEIMIIMGYVPTYIYIYIYVCVLLILIWFMYTYVICVVGWWLLMFGSGDLLVLGLSLSMMWITTLSNQHNGTARSLHTAQLLNCDQLASVLTEWELILQHITTVSVGGIVRASVDNSMWPLYIVCHHPLLLAWRLWPEFFNDCWWWRLVRFPVVWVIIYIYIHGWYIYIYK